jgi:hypothetical protein
MSNARDDLAGDKAAQLYHQQAALVDSLEKNAEKNPAYKKAAENIEKNTGRWDSPEAKKAGKESRRSGGRG